MPLFPTSSDMQTQELRNRVQEAEIRLSEKVQEFEYGIVNWVHGATVAIDHTVKSLKDIVAETAGTVEGAIEEAMASVKQGFDVAGQVRRNPWLLILGAFVLGYSFGGFILGGGPGSQMVSQRRSS